MALFKRKTRKTQDDQQRQLNVSGYPNIEIADDLEPFVADIDQAEFPQAATANKAEMIFQAEADAQKQQEQAKKKQREATQAELEDLQHKKNLVREQYRVLHLELNEIFKQPQPAKVTSLRPYQADKHISALSYIFPEMAKQGGESQEKAFIIHNKIAALAITQNKIAFIPAPQIEGESQSAAKPVFNADSAYAMVLVASKNQEMLKKGIKLNGTDEQKELMRQAVARVNAELPAKQQLKIRGEQAQVPPVAFAAATAAPVAKADTIDPQHVVRAAPAQDDVLKNPARRGFFGMGAKASIPDKTTTEKPAIAPKEVVVAAAAGKGIISRRGVVAGLIGTAVAASALGGSTNEAEAGTLAEFFGFKPSEHHDEQLADAGVPKKGRRVATPTPRPPRKLKKPRHETKKQRARRLKADKANLRQWKAEQAQHAKTNKVTRQKADAQTTREIKPRADKNKYQIQESLSGGVIFSNVHTKEQFRFNFCDTGTRTCRSDFNNFARDFHVKQRRSNEQDIINMDPALLDKVARVVTSLRQRGHNVSQVCLLSGYRTHKTNEILRLERGGQAKNSQHCIGKALDIMVPGVGTKELFNVVSAVVAASGGVGFYPSSGFVHMDTRGYHARW